MEYREKNNNFKEEHGLWEKFLCKVLDYGLSENWKEAHTKSLKIQGGARHVWHKQFLSREQRGDGSSMDE